MDQVLRCRADFSQVRPVPTSSVGSNHQAFLFHQALHDFLGDVQLASAECCAHSPVAVATVIALEHVGNGNPGICILVRPLEPCTVIEVRAARQVQLSQQFRQRVRVLQGVNQQGLLPIAQELRGDAQAFF